MLIDEVCQFENVDEGVKKNAKIAELAKLSDKSEQISAEEKRESKQKRKKKTKEENRLEARKWKKRKSNGDRVRVAYDEPGHRSSLD